MAERSSIWTIAVVTGCRADYGLLRPVMRAIAALPTLRLQTIVTGTHLLPEVNTRDEVAAEFDIAARVPMQQPGANGRSADAIALGRGIVGLAQAFDRLDPDVVLVLGDRIEAFAAAAAASVGGRLVAHVHGGDRAEGVADEAMRHAISKLAHIHFPATQQSADRLARMGESVKQIHVVGSPAIDDLATFKPLDDDHLLAMKLHPARPVVVVLHHPCGLNDDVEAATMAAILQAVEAAGFGGNIALCAPNHDPGRAGVLRAIGDRLILPHLRRGEFIGLLRRAQLLIGNSSAGLIEAAALGLRVVNVGPRQSGRERADNVVDAADPALDDIRRALEHAGALQPSGAHPYGDGCSGQRIAAILAQLRDSPALIRKRNEY